MAEFDIDLDWIEKPLGDIYLEQLFTGKLGVIENLFLDAITEKLKIYDSPTCKISIKNREIIVSTIFNSEVPAKIDLNNDYGLIQEYSAYTLFTAVFGENAKHSPKYYEGKLEREISDILCWYEKGIFIIESKCLSKFDLNQADDVKIRNTRRHIRKSLKQIKGSMRKIRSRDADVKLLNIPIEAFEMPIQVIILIGESYIFSQADWDAECKEIEKICKIHNALINVMDLQELSDFIHMSGYKSEKVNLGRDVVLDYMLLDRFKFFIKTGKLNIRTKFEERESLSEV